MKNNNTSNSTQVLFAKFMSHNGISRSHLMVFCFVLCALSAGLDYMSEFHVHSIRTSLEKSVAPLKIKAHQLIQIPKLVKNFLDIKHENELLRQELDILKIENIKANEQIQELDEIKKNLNIKYSSERFDLAEKVLGFEASIYNSCIIISRTHENIVDDSIVITPDGLVGVINAVYEKSAKVLPLTNSLTAIPVKTNSGIHLIIKGTDQNEMVAVEIKQDDAISKLTVGDILYTSGEGGFYEKGIPVAKIINVGSNKAEIRATPIVQVSHVNYVWIINSKR